MSGWAQTAGRSAASPIARESERFPFTRYTPEPATITTVRSGKYHRCVVKLGSIGLGD